MTGDVQAAPENHVTAQQCAAERARVKARRGFMRRTLAAAGGAVAAASGAKALARGAAGEPPHIAPWTKSLGAPVAATGYGMPSKLTGHDAPRPDERAQ